MLWCHTRGMRADPATKGVIVLELILDVMCGEFKCVHPVGRLNDERRNDTVPSSLQNDFSAAEESAPFAAGAAVRFTAFISVA
eukprot:2053479-Pyramimonas_sp.AAC.1